MRLAAKIAASGDLDAADDRRDGRTRLRLDANLGSTTDNALDLVIHDISCGGFSGNCADRFVAGQRVSVQLLPSLVREAEIVRHKGTTIAGSFATPLSADELRHVVTASPVVWGEFRSSTSQDRGNAVAATTPGTGLGEADAPLGGQWAGWARSALIIGSSAGLWVLILRLAL